MTEFRVMRFGVVFDVDEARGIARSLRRFRDHCTDELAFVMNGRRLQYVQVCVGFDPQLRRVLMRHHQQYTRQYFRG